ncbi:MAG TPA: PASTA domain-containing protein [Pyrinomonadaceae bacterium]
MSQQKPTVFTAIRRIAIVAAILIAFVVGLAGTVYLSLRSPEVKVPEVVGQHYLSGQNALESAGLNIRRRAKRLKGDAKPDTILDQSPRAGEVVKKGQTVAVVIADENSGKEIPSETPEPVETPAGKPQNANTNAAPRNENQNRDQRNRNTNRNANSNNRNANNQNANNRNANNSNRNANQNSNRNANRNGNTNNANNRNANNRNANANGARNSNANRSTPTLNINRPNSNAPARPNSNNANRRTP